MSRIFECKEMMPPPAGSNDVVRTAMSPGDVVNVSLSEAGMRRTRVAGNALHDPEKDVSHVERPVRGRPY